MPRWLVGGRQTGIAIAVCDRCKMKRFLSQLGRDPNFPGLRVCNEGCLDQLDPWRLPARVPERVTLNYPRPDVPLDGEQAAPTLVLGTENNVAFITNNDEYLAP